MQLLSPLQHSLISGSVLYRGIPHTYHTVPVFLLYIDPQEIGTNILLLSRSWGLESQVLPWKCTDYPALTLQGELTSQKAVVGLLWLLRSYCVFEKEDEAVQETVLLYDLQCVESSWVSVDFPGSTATPVTYTRLKHMDELRCFTSIIRCLCCHTFQCWLMLSWYIGTWAATV